jgi:hypothetical protein
VGEERLLHVPYKVKIMPYVAGVSVRLFVSTVRVETVGNISLYFSIGDMDV